MSDNSHEAIRMLLASERPEEVRRGLELVKEEISKIGSSEAKSLFEMVSSVFYIDPLDRPDMVPVLDEALSLVAGFGDWVIPALLHTLDTGDIKAQLAISHALGRIGADAIEPLMEDYEGSSDPARRQFIVYAMGKIKSPKIVEAARVALDAAESSDLELRDTGTRAIGKFVESIPPGSLPRELKEAFIERLHVNLSDPDAGVRAKAVRSLGKLAKYGHLNDEETGKLRRVCEIILGMDENREWDQAYIVRKEAQEALNYT